MAQHYSSKDFFRNTPNIVLSRYFEIKGVFASLDLSELKETKLESLYKAWDALDSEVRNRLDAELITLNDLSGKKGCQAIIDEAKYQFRNTPEKYQPFVDMCSEVKNHYHRAMVVFLDYPECWKGASRFYEADTLSHWRKRKHMGHKLAAVDEVSIKQLAKEIGAYFHDVRATGSNCEVEAYRRNDLDYFFCFPEDHSQAQSEWVNNQFKERPHNPAFTIVMVYCQERGSLDIQYQGSRKPLVPLQTMFANNILKLDTLPENPKDTREYDLNILAKNDFSYAVSPSSGITNIAIKKLKLSSKYTQGERLTLEANSEQNNSAVHELMDRVGQSIKLSEYNITLVELGVSFSADDPNTPRSSTIIIRHPNTCSLKYDDVGRMLRKMLEDSGIEPLELPEITE